MAAVVMGMAQGSRARSPATVGTIVLAALLVAVLGLGHARGRPLRAQIAGTRQCGEPGIGPRDPVNPLGLGHAPGADPLTGAHLFVDGPRHGAAASAIAQAVGIDPRSLPDSLS